MVAGRWNPRHRELVGWVEWNAKPIIVDAGSMGFDGAQPILRRRRHRAASQIRRSKLEEFCVTPSRTVLALAAETIAIPEIDEMLSCFGKALDDTWAMVKEKELA